MTEEDIAEIERALSISLPSAYKSLMLERSNELREINNQFGVFAESLYFVSKEVITTNLDCREGGNSEEMIEIFPQWWETFFLIGGNGAGDYFCVRLDDQPGVWMIGTDCGDEPQLIEQSLAEFVDVPLEFHRRGYERWGGENMPLPSPITPQTAAESRIEQALLGHWSCPESETSCGDVYFEVGRVAFGHPPTPGNAENEMRGIRESIAMFEGWLREQPMHLENPAWKKRCAELKVQLKGLESGELAATPIGFSFEVLDVNASDEWIDLRYQFENGGGGDWHLQFEGGRDSLIWTRKEYYRTNFAEPERWTRSPEP